ncbi:MAG: hypothetical protein UH103_01305 [Paludibacteraceae bacterium]|nr:hypothetical protein [Paludibacteraceae bacterium]
MSKKKLNTNGTLLNLLLLGGAAVILKKRTGSLRGIGAYTDKYGFTVRENPYKIIQELIDNREELQKLNSVWMYLNYHLNILPVTPPRELSHIYKAFNSKVMKPQYNDEPLLNRYRRAIDYVTDIFRSEFKNRKLFDYEIDLLAKQLYRHNFLDGFEEEFFEQNL